MFGTAVIVFREVLEAALIIGIVAAATRTVPGRARWIAGGLLLGIAGACVVAALTDVIARMAEGVGQEIFNAAILGVAVAMLAWHNIWMSAHASEISARAQAMGAAISGGVRERSALLIIVGLAVLREGSETVLFLNGIAAADGGANLPQLLGGVAGALAGALTGYATYFGLLRIPLRWFFNATAALVLLLAAGLAAQAVGFLIQADLIAGPSAPLWDTSRSLPEDSIAGALLHGLIGYQARPNALQIAGYAITLVAIGIGMRCSGKSRISGGRT
jgi:high-affinity iron transporter